MVKQLDDEAFSNTPQKTAKSPLKRLFVTRAGGDGRDVERSREENGKVESVVVES